MKTKEQRKSEKAEERNRSRALREHQERLDEAEAYPTLRTNATMVFMTLMADEALYNDPRADECMAEYQRFPKKIPVS